MLLAELHHRMGGRVNLLIVLPFEHLGTAVKQYHAEDSQHPRELLHQRTQREDEDEPQHDGTQNAPEEHPVVVLLLDAEAHENHDHHKDVVYRQRLLQEVARQILTEHLFAVDVQVRIVPQPRVEHRCQRRPLGILHQVVDVPYAVNPLRMETDNQGQHHRQRNPYSRPDGALLHSNLVVFLVKNPQVHRQHNDDEHHKEPKE